MASAFGHLFAGWVIKKTVTDTPASKRFWFFLLLSTVVADFDVITFRFGIPYESPWGHRGFTHSIAFAVLWSLIMVILLSRARALVLRQVMRPSGVVIVHQFSKLGTFALFFLATMSHSLLDGMTNGGLGVGFLVPFADTRYFLPWTPVEVSPIGVGNFFTAEGLRVIHSEAYWIGAPGLILVVITSVLRRFLK